MSNESLQQALSALMDNQADDLQMQLILQSIDQPEVRALWTRMNIAQSAQHEGNSYQADFDISAGVMAAIADEEILLVDSVSDMEKSFEQTQTNVTPLKPKKKPVILRFAVAASVTLAVVVGMRFYNLDEVNTFEMTAANSDVEVMEPLPNQVTQSSELVSFNKDESIKPVAEVLEGQSEVIKERLPEYLKHHAQQASEQGSDSSLPYARSLSVEE